MRALAAIVAAIGLSSYALPVAVRAPVSLAARHAPVQPRNLAVKPPFGSAAPAADTAGSPEAAHLLNDARRFDARPGLARPIPLVASNDFMQAQQAPYTDLANSHIYPTPPSDVAARVAGFRQKVVESKVTQGIITEWGRTTGGSASNTTSPPVTIAQQATLLASDVKTAMAQSYVHTISIYELFCWKGTTEITNFGLFNTDLTPRPAVAAIRAAVGA